MDDADTLGRQERPESLDVGKSVATGCFAHIPPRGYTGLYEIHGR